MWKEGLLLSCINWGLTDECLTGLKIFCLDGKILVCIGSDLSNEYTVGNGIPQSHVISPLLFIIMINDVFSSIPEDIGRSLFADDGALWEIGRNIEHAVRKVQRGIDKVVEWGYDWVFYGKNSNCIFHQERKYGRDEVKDVW